MVLSFFGPSLLSFPTLFAKSLFCQGTPFESSVPSGRVPRCKCQSSNWPNVQAVGSVVGCILVFDAIFESRTSEFPLDFRSLVVPLPGNRAGSGTDVGCASLS